jgi:hypothetical protein
MNRENIIKLAREADREWDTDYADRIMFEFLSEFANLIEQHLIESGYRKCAEGQRTTQYCAMVEEAVKKEREACACVRMFRRAAIRARGEA